MNPLLQTKFSKLFSGSVYCKLRSSGSFGKIRYISPLR